MSLRSSASPAGILATILLGFLIYCASNVIYNIYFHPLSRFPGPKLWVGNYFLRWKAGVKGSLEESIKGFHGRYGPVVRFSPNELSFIEPEAWNDIYGFRENGPLKDPAFYGPIHLARDNSDSIFTADEEHHPHVRKALSYAFSEKALRDQEPFVKKYVDLLIQRLRERTTGPTKTIDIVLWYHFTTFDVIGSLAIAQSFQCLQTGKYHEWVKGFWETLKLGAFVRATSMSMPPFVVQLIRLLAPKGLKESRRRHMEFVGRSTEDRVAQGILRDKPDFISYVLKSNRGQEKAASGVSVADGIALSAGEIEANANFLLMAGTETTATALSGITYFLLKNPNALRRVTEEVRNGFKREADITFLTAAERLPYLQACVAEGLRLYPPGPIALPRRTPKGTVTMIAGHAVPGDVTVGVHSWSASHSPTNFHRASEFMPERWLLGAAEDPSSPFRNDRFAASQPFSIGSRNCLGKSFAKNELRVILARVLWNFDMELSPESEAWDKQKVYTLWDKGPMMVKLIDARVGRV
ncbi:putative cytochrome P450 monooxygenase [Xylariaceae sp. AK1471]|nr:putative cytochrome P450 monooxygenase [Xylariaceae sp. AK1471]